ncbi:hypothetical protein EI555_013480 [Monodon monoceros]|uniref:Translation elongation factor EF1B beta/delta subunit guanine nucleotide exchange domain-containing protein n=1 Tax=Monodon monoceros TaxID=40151 RepID=A0A4U1EHU0_MONMO|nr:hypothetical protein EI555_013480 [Monodon monoceros]
MSQEPEKTSISPWLEAQALRPAVGPGGDHSELVIRIASLEVENQSLRGVVQDLQQAVSKLEAWLSALEKSSPTHPATAPQTQHVSPVHQVERPTQKAVTVTEDNEDEDDDIDLLGSDEQEDQEAAWLREERLQQYAEKKLGPVGYGTHKLQIQCVVEDDKVGTDLLEEEITKFEEHVQSIDTAAFNKI